MECGYNECRDEFKKKCRSNAKKEMKDSISILISSSHFQNASLSDSLSIENNWIPFDF